MTEFETKLLEVLNNIHKELLISNQPLEKRNDQRMMYFVNSRIKHYTNILEKIPEGPLKQKYETNRSIYMETYDRLIENGIVDSDDLDIL